MKPVGLFLLAMVTKMAEATPRNDTLGASDRDASETGEVFTSEGSLNSTGTLPFQTSDEPNPPLFWLASLEKPLL